MEHAQTHACTKRHTNTVLARLESAGTMPKNHAISYSTVRQHRKENNGRRQYVVVNKEIAVFDDDL